MEIIEPYTNCSNYKEQKLMFFSLNIINAKKINYRTFFKYHFVVSINPNMKIKNQIQRKGKTNTLVKL